MKTIALILASLAVAALAEPAKNDAKDDLQKIQGTWIAVAVTLEGNKLADDEAKNVRLVCDGNKYTYEGNSEVRKGTFKLDSKATPRTMDSSETEGSNVGDTW